RFFFEAEDGIRDFHVTGVQTSALPISAKAVPPHRDRMPVAAAAATIPLLRVCRNVLSSCLKNGGEAVRPTRERSAFPGPAVTRGRDGRAGHRQAVTHVLPKAGFSAPITLTVLPQALTGMWIGSWITLPERTPGDPIAAPWAPES